VLGLALAFVDLVAAGGNFYKECDATWNPQNCWASDNGNAVSLALVSNTSGTLSFFSFSISMQAFWFLDFRIDYVVARLADPVQEAVRLWHRVGHDSARQGPLCRHRHNILCKSIISAF
jgi:hypothetical protein